MSRAIFDENQFTCRICLDDGERKDFIAPCACMGSQKWVHRACLDRWRSTREDKAFSKCTECLKLYKLVCLTDDNTQLTHSRRCRFAMLIMRDFSLVLFATQLLIAVLASIVYAFDKHSHALIEYLKQEGHPVLFYYLSGLLLSLSMLGMCFTVIQIGCCGDPSSVNNGTCCNGSNPNSCRAVDCMCPDCYYTPCIYTTPHATAGDCCCCSNCCESGTAGTTTCCGECGSLGSGGGGCSECAGGAEVGAECAMCLVAMVVLFAIVGVFVCVILGVAYAQSIVRTHWHVLEKYTLATDYIVADLAADALPIGKGTNGSGGDSNYANGEDIDSDMTITGGGSGSIMGSASQYHIVPSAPAPLNDDSSGGYNSGYVGMELVSMPNNNMYNSSRANSSNSSTDLLLPMSHTINRSSSSSATIPATTTTNVPSTSHSTSGRNAINNGGFMVEPSAPYDPLTSHLTRQQYEELSRRGLL